jgi:hypothetical protein
MDQTVLPETPPRFRTSPEAEVTSPTRPPLAFSDEELKIFAFRLHQEVLKVIADTKDLDNKCIKEYERAYLPSDALVFKEWVNARRQLATTMLGEAQAELHTTNPNWAAVVQKFEVLQRVAYADYAEAYGEAKKKHVA